MATGEPLFLGFFDTADNMAIDTIWQKYTFRQKSGVSEIVCREKVKRNRILWFLAERYIILSANAVEIWEMVKVGYNLAKANSFAKLYGVSLKCMDE